MEIERLPYGAFLACSILRSAKYNMVGTEIAENFLLRKGAIDFSPSCSSSHKGFSFIDVLQPCFTFFNTYDYYNERVYEFSSKDHDVSDRKAAFVKAGEWAYGEGEKIPIGIFYQVKKPTYEEKLLAGRIPVQLTPGDIRPVLNKHI